MPRDTIDRINQRRLTPDQLLAAYDELVPLYGHVPPLILWRVWELAAYRAYSLDEPLLDVGCGDGRFFRMAFPHMRDVIGVDFNAAVAAHAARSGVYRGVAVARTDSLPIRAEVFASAFANCSLEHMDHLDAVLTGVARALRPGGTFLLSVVTNEFVSWAPLSKLLSACGSPTIGSHLQAQHETYHHLVNALPITQWYEQLHQAGFELLEQVPIVAGAAGRMFLLLDQLWHVSHEHGELGEEMLAWMERTPRSAAAVRQIFAGLLSLVSTSDEHAGVVLLARKPKAMTASHPIRTAELVPSVDDRIRSCWCGNADLTPFSHDYAHCGQCQTLVLIGNVRYQGGRVIDDERDFYGRDYWFGHQAELGHVDIEERARADLAERCLYWLRTLLRYRRPPGSALELGCAHGGFVALLRSVGFDAQGLELSPSIADFARRSFGIPVLVGPVEEQQLPVASLDLVLAMDVLEHLEDPLRTLAHCAHLLRPHGAFVFQSPCYPEGATYEELQAGRSGFLAMLQPQEHIYLFSRTSIRTLFERLGFDHAVFEPAIFAHYDMFVLASRAPLIAGNTFPPLAETKDARMVQALLDLDAEVTALKRTVATHSADIVHLTSELERIEQDPTPTRFELDRLRQHLRASEDDRAARLEVIERQGAQLVALSAEVDRWLREAERLYDRVNGLESERNRARSEVADLYQQFTASEADRAARLEVIERQGADVAKLSGEVDHWLREAEGLWTRIDSVEAERNASQSELRTLWEHYHASEADRAARLEVIERQGRELARVPQLEADAAFLKERIAKSEAVLSQQGDDLMRARSAVNRLQIRIAVARNSPMFRFLRRFGFLKVLTDGDASTAE